MRAYVVRVLYFWFAIYGAVTLGDELIGAGAAKVPWYVRALITMGIVVAMWLRLVWDSRRACAQCGHHPNAHRDGKCQAVCMATDGVEPVYYQCVCGSSEVS